jgi:HK97 family phage prohead protease
MTSRFTRLVPSGAPEVVSDSRVVRYTFSTPEVGRDNHTVAADAWQLDNFLRNPVFLWAHDDSLPPIGRVIQIGDAGGVLRGSVEYAAASLNPFAETIYQMVRAGYISAVSTSWQPIEWDYSRDRDRPKGIDFTKVDLLEVSQVPIPALPDALASASARGINVRPFRDWAERELESRQYLSLPRKSVEAIYRAVSKPAVSTRPRRRADRADAGRRARVAAVQEIIRRGERMERARRLAAGEKAGYVGADRAKLRAAQRHLKRAAKHHEAISLRHGESHGQLEELQKIHERATSTLSELGERSAHSKISRHLEALDRCIREMRSTHEDQADSLDFIGSSICDAGECVDTVLDQVEPAGVADR